MATPRRMIRSADCVQFDPIHRGKIEKGESFCEEVCLIHSGQNGRIAMRRHHTSLQEQHHIALTLMSREEERITALIASLRRSALNVDKERARARKASDAALKSALDTRRGNLIVTIAAFEDRLSAIHGLLELDRPHVVNRMH
jgi:hypothetical protein